MKCFFDKISSPDKRVVSALAWTAAVLNGLIALIYLFIAAKTLYDYLTIPIPEVISYIDMLEGNVKLPPHISAVLLGLILGAIPAAMCAACILSALCRADRRNCVCVGVCLLIVGVLSLVNAVSAIAFFPVTFIFGIIAAASIVAVGVIALIDRKPAAVLVIPLSALSLALCALSPVPMLCPVFYTAALCLGAVAVVMRRSSGESEESFNLL